MKRLAAFLLLVVSFLVRTNPLSAVPAENPFSWPIGTVVLDAGHGGTDPGAISEGQATVLEKELTLDLAVRVASMLAREDELEVVMTRSDDSFVALADRAAVAAEHDPKVGKGILLVSIHANSSTFVEPSGFEVLIKHTEKRVRFLENGVKDWVMLRYANHTMGELNRLLNRENLLLASSLERSMRDEFPSARSRGVKEQDVWVLNASKVPSALVEVGFLSNRDDLVALADPQWRERMAGAIAAGILGYINRD